VCDLGGDRDGWTEAAESLNEQRRQKLKYVVGCVDHCRRDVGDELHDRLRDRRRDLHGGEEAAWYVIKACGHQGRARFDAKPEPVDTKRGNRDLYLTAGGRRQKAVRLRRSQGGHWQGGHRPDVPGQIVELVVVNRKFCGRQWPRRGRRHG
jgi:hypothetical protein